MIGGLALPAATAAARASAPAFAVCVCRMCGRSSRMIAVSRRTDFTSWRSATSRWISGTSTTSTPSRSATYAIESSPRARLPATSVVWYPRVSSPAARLATWIAGPPMFSRAMTRRMRIGSGTALTLATIRVRSRVVVVLFTSVGQRVDIVRAFKAAGAVTLGVDADPLAPALYHCERHALVPPIADPEYVPTLAALVSEHEVGLVVPLNDLDFPVLARARERLAPALVLLPDAEVVRAHVGQARRPPVLPRERHRLAPAAGPRKRFLRTRATPCS